MIQRKKRNSSKVNLIISAVFHSVLILAIFFLAAREGMLGKKLKEITVTMVPKEKKPEPPKAKPEEPKVETAKPTEAPKANVPAPKVETAAAPPPAANNGAPVAAPAPSSLAAFDFSDGAKEVQTISDPNGVYKMLIEHHLRSRWNRPEDLDDTAFVAEVEIGVDAVGKMKDARWVNLSGNPRWDASVKQVVAETKGFSKPPPKNFPAKFVVRFDVESSKTEPLIQVSSR